MLSKIENLLPADVVDIVNTQKTQKGDAKYSLVERFKSIARIDGVDIMSEYLAMSELFSSWRNKMVHRSHSTEISSVEKDLLLRRSDFFKDNHGGADIKEIISQFERGEKPDLLQVSTLFSSIYKLIRSIDYAVIDRVEPKAYLHSLVKFMIQSSENPKERLNTLWEYGEKRAAGRVQSYLLEMGVCTRGYVRESAPKMAKEIYFETIPNGRNEARNLFL